MKCLLMRRGFTLIECVITLVLISIFALYVTSSIPISSTNLMLATEKLEADVIYAKTLAMTNGGSFGITFDSLNNKYTVFQNSIATPVTDPSNPSQSLIVNFTTTQTYHNVTVVSVSMNNTSTLLFNARGIPEDANGVALTANGQISLSNGTQTKTMTIAPGTGKVSTS